MQIKKFELGPLGTNCYIVYNVKERNALIIDPGGDADIVVSFLKEQQLEPKAILLTHAHFDHIGAVDHLRAFYSLDVYLHENEKNWLHDASLNRSLVFSGTGIVTADPEYLLRPGEMNIAGFDFEVLHTPGHSPGSTSFVFHQDGFTVSGDVLFQHGIGRTDLPEGDFQEIVQSIQNELYQLPDQFIVYPGHGPATTIGEEKRNNPFVPAHM